MNREIILEELKNKVSPTYMDHPIDLDHIEWVDKVVRTELKSLFPAYPVIIHTYDEYNCLTVKVSPFIELEIHKNKDIQIWINREEDHNFRLIESNNLEQTIRIVKEFL